jgi:hypothetical protein
MEVLVHGLGHRVGQPRQGLELLERGALHRVDTAELLDQALLAGGPEPGDVVEHRLGHPLVAQLAVVADGEAVALVSQPLQQVQRLGLPREAHRIGLAREVHLLELLGQRRHRDLVVEPSSWSTFTATPSWPLPPSTSNRLGG